MEVDRYVEHRRSDRVGDAVPIHFTIASEGYGVAREAITMDRSSHGLKIRTAVPLSQGEAVLVSSLGGTRCAIPGRVVWVRGAEPSFEGTAGLAFLSSLPHR